MAGQLLLINPKRRRRSHAGTKRRRARRGRMPAALARYWATHRRGASSKRRTHHRARRRSALRTNPIHVMRRRSVRRYASRRRRNPSVRGLVGSLVPMTIEAATGAAGSLVIDYLWGQVNPRLPANLQSVPGKLGIGDAVKVAGTVAFGTLANRITRGFALKAARGALTVQMERIIRGFLPDNIRMQLAYAQPAPVTGGQYWTGPNRIYRGGGIPLRGTLGALQRPGGPTQLLSALQRRGGPTQLLSNWQGEGFALRY